MRILWILFILAAVGSCNRSSPPDAEAILPRARPESTRGFGATDIDLVQFEQVVQRFQLPKPEEFPVKSSEMYSGRPKPVILKEKRALEYRTVIRESAQRGPNFAGHYTVITWGAGMGNFSLAVADARTGQLIFPPFESVSKAGYDLQFDEDDARIPAFRKDSTLFAFMGCPGKEYEGCVDWDKDGFYVYNFERNQFRLLKFVKRDEFNAAGRRQ